jgi:hypothetical protein
MFRMTSVNATLGTLRAELAMRLGFVPTGPAAQHQRAELDSFLQEAQEYVYAQTQGNQSACTASFVTSPGERLYDWHDRARDQTIEPHRVQEVGIQHAKRYEKLVHGISAHKRESQLARGCPRYYDNLNKQLLLWPTPNARYTVILTYHAALPQLEQDADRPGVPEKLLLLYAIASAKAHYRHADAAVAGKAFDALLREYQSRQHGQRRYFMHR